MALLPVSQGWLALDTKTYTKNKFMASHIEMTVAGGVKILPRE